MQTPTLRLVVDRDRQITSFVQQPFWSLFLTLNTGTDSFIAEWLPPENVSDEDNRCIHEQAARLVGQHVQQSGQAIVNSVETKRAKESAPLPFDLGSLQQVCSKKWGMGAQQVLTIAQSLYETHKATTYPRTDCGYLPESMFAEVPRVLAAMIKTDSQLQPLTARLNPQFKSRAWNDKKISAHHGMIPTMQAAELGKMTDEERKVYNLICSHYLAQFFPLHECDKTQVMLTSANQSFRAQGKAIIILGWKTLFSKDLDASSSELDIEQNIPAMIDGQRCSVTDIEIRALKTKPPEHFTDGTLIAAMKNAARFVTDERLKQRLKESAGIGTEATRAGIIETLLKRGYLVKKKRFLVASDTAALLIDAIPDVIKDPGTTALWEQALDSIATGELKLDDFLAKQSIWIGKIVEYAKQQSLVK
ncbi:DNA topoisomerase [Photorhabdus tasmaniensis]